MGFTTPIFLFLLFPIFIAGYYLAYLLEKAIPKIKSFRLRDIVLVCTSIVFYAWACFDHVYYLIALILFVYIIGRLVEYFLSRDKKGVAKGILMLSVISLVAYLFFTKYYNSTGELFNNIINRNYFKTISVVAPLGISFLFFSCISYLIDIYRGIAPSKNFLDCSLYISFFQKVVSGPIVLWRDFSPQIKSRQESCDLFLTGINRIVVGFAKKVIIADTFGVLISEILKNVSVGIDVPTAWGCTFLYMLQIYYDFAGYSDIAIGLSALVGFKLADNFCFPYLSTSITEFWGNWHISLGNWFKQYVYIPLGGNRKGKLRTLVNLATIFILSGIWHGAGLGYLAWGLMHAACRVFEACVKDNPLYTKVPKPLKWLCTMGIVMFGWMFFLHGSFSGVLDFLKIMLGVTRFDSIYLTWQYYFGTKIIVLSLIAILGATLLRLKIFEKLHAATEEKATLFILKEALLLALMILSVIFMINSTYSPFIYFQY